MNEVARCRECGIRYDAHRDRCPRCGCLQSPGEEVGAGTSVNLSGFFTLRRFAASAAVIGLIAALGASLMWARGADVIASESAPSPLARAFQKEPRGTMGTARVQADVPFIDSDAAGRQEYDAGDFEAALAEFRTQAERDPGDAAARSNAGQVLIRMGRTEEALPFLQEACDLDPSRWAYRFNLARAQGLLGRWANAVEDYGKAAALFPGDYATLFNLAQALHRAGREEEAVAQYRLAIDRKGDDATFYLALGISEEKLGHAAEAATAYRRCVTMDPSAKEAAAVTARARQLEAAAAAAPTPAPAPAAEGAAPGAGL